MNTVRVTQVVLKHDMRKIHTSRRSLCRGLGRGEAVLALNKRCTIARVVDASGAIYQMYCDEAECFDVDEIQTRVGNLYLRLNFTSEQAEAVDSATEQTVRRKRIKRAA